ncbi:MAG: hypothetical protein ACTSP4_11350 [Candidatus Hodarchaeales archaeon]
MTAISGGPIDLILFTNDGYAEFLVAFTNPDNSFSVIEEGSALNVADSVVTSTLQPAGVYQAVVENSNAVEGAVPTGPVDIHITITLYDSKTGAGRPLLETLTGDFTAIAFTVIAITVVLVSIYYIVNKKRRKKRWGRKR